MAQAMTIFSLLTYFILAVNPQVGNEQSHTSVRFILASKFELNPRLNLPFYACKFMYTVDCLWQLNGTTIQPHMYNYSYVKNNGMSTDDCTIQRKSNTKKIYKDKLNNDDVTCIGIAKEGSINLTCKLSKPGTCTWKRNDQTIKIDGERYKYVQQHNGTNAQDCSIIIERVQSIDYAKWECSPIATDSDNPSKPVIYHLSKSSLTGGKNTSNINCTNSHPSIATATSPPKSGSAGLEKIITIVVCITSIVAAVIVAAVYYFCCKQKPPEEYQIQESSQKNQEIKTEYEEIELQNDNDCSPGATTSHVYYNTQANVSRPQISLSDADGYLIPKLIEKPTDLKNTSDDFKTVKNHVYEKIP